MRRIWTMGLAALLLALLLVGCGAEPDDGNKTAGESVRVDDPFTETSAPTNEKAFRRLSRMLDETPRRIIEPLPEPDRLSFASTEQAVASLIDAIEQGDLAQADRIVASLPPDQRKPALREVDEQAYQLRRSEDYLRRWHFEHFRHYDPTQLWQLDGARLSGTIIDAHTRSPVADVQIREDLSGATTRSDASGHFELVVPAEQMLQLTLQHPDYQWHAINRTGDGRMLTLAALDGAPLEIELTPVAGNREPTGDRVLIVELHDAESGEPMRDVSVTVGGEAVGVTAVLTGNSTARTDDSGRIEGRGLGEGTVDLLITGQARDAQGRYRAYYHTVTGLEFESGVAQRIEVPALDNRIERERFLVGRVRDASSGEPVAGATVAADSNLAARTDDQGRYRLVLPGQKGHWRIVASHPDYHRSPIQDFDASGPGRHELDFSLAPITTARVTGVVVDRTDGSPIASAQVRLAGDATQTDAQGRFEFDEVEADEWSVEASAEGWHPGTLRIALQPRQHEAIRLELEPITTGTITGRVTDAASGQALAGASVAGGGIEVSTDSEGRFLLDDVEAGQVVVTARMDHHLPAKQTVRLAAMESVAVELALEPITWGTVHGTVADADSGQPLPGVVVSIGGLQVTSDERGAYRLEQVPAGTLTIRAHKPVYHDSEQSVVLEADSAARVDLVLQPITTGRVSGRVLTADGGQPVAGAKVHIGAQQTITDAEGRFGFDTVDAGTVRIDASAERFMPGHSIVTIEPATEAQADIRLEPITWGRIAGTVVDARSGQPLKDAQVSAGSQSARTDAAGHFVLDPVDAGETSVHTRHAKYLDHSLALELPASETLKVEIPMVPITWGSVAGQVVDAESGQPLAGAQVRLAGTRQRTGPDGRFGFERIETGEVQVQADLPAYHPGSVNATVKAAEQTDVRIALTPIREGRIVGRVVDARTGAAIAAARVSTSGAATETDAQGRFSFASVPTGPQTVSARHPDYADGATTVEVPPGAQADAVLRLDLRREDVTRLEQALTREGTIDLYGIYFDSGKDQFKPSSLSTLQAVLEVMRRAPAQHFIITGHTDADGSDEYNQDLSERRAQRVIDWLIEHGIERERLTAVGKGEAEPVAPNDSESGKALNRRVQLSTRVR